MKMEEMIEKAIKAMAVFGIALALFSGIAMAESSAREKVVQEALHALDQSNTNDISKQYAQNTKGNWNWLSAVSITYNKMKEKYTVKNVITDTTTNCFASLWSTATDGSGCAPFTGTKPVSFYSDAGAYGFYDNKGRGMQCKAFANGVLYATGQKDITGDDIFIGWSTMLLTVTDNGQVADRIDKIRHVKAGDVIIDKSIVTEVRNANGALIKYIAYPYTVTAIIAGSSDAGAVISIQAKDYLGNTATISGTELEKYSIAKYMRGKQFAQPGDVIFRTRHIAESSDHAAIVVKTAGDYGSVTSIDVVDSNYVGDEEIGHHTIQNVEFDKYYVYKGVSYYDEIWSLNVPIVPPIPSPGTEPVLFRYKNSFSPADPENNKVYEIKQDTAGRKYKQWIIDAKVFNDLGYDWSKIIDDEFGYNLRIYITGENIVFKDSTLIIRPDGRIYEIKNNEKHWFPDWNSFAGNGYTLAMTYPVSDQLADLIPNGIAIDYRLVKTAASGNVYLIQTNETTGAKEKKHIMDPDAMAIWGFDWSKIETISDAEMNSYPYASELDHARYGTLIGKESEKYTANPVLYFISADYEGNPIKREIHYTETLAYLGKSADSAYWLSDSEFSSIPIKEIYYFYYWQEPDYDGEGRGGVPTDPDDCASCHIEPMPIPTPATTTPIPTPAPTPTPTPDPLAKFDLNSDCAINIADLIIAASHFGEATFAPYPAYDINQDNIIDISDLSLIGQHNGLTY
ncbi:hypothetical protein KKB43_05395 [Patescibacteria group bacterium]|nr:hypothetical protein [Patescibacteria group bacterium]